MNILYILSRASPLVIPSEARDLTNVLPLLARFFASLRMTRVLVRQRVTAALLLCLLTKFAAADPNIVAGTSARLA
jgi:hypothetical protein